MDAETENEETADRRRPPRWTPSSSDKASFLRIAVPASVVVGTLSGVAQFIGPYAGSGLMSLLYSAGIVALLTAALVAAIAFGKFRGRRIILSWPGLVLLVVVLLGVGAAVGVGGLALRHTENSDDRLPAARSPAPDAGLSRSPLIESSVPTSRTRAGAEAAARVLTEYWARADFAKAYEMFSKRSKGFVSEIDYLTIQKKCRKAATYTEVLRASLREEDSYWAVVEVRTDGFAPSVLDMVFEDGMWRLQLPQYDIDLYKNGPSAAVETMRRRGICGKQ